MKHCCTCEWRCTLDQQQVLSKHSVLPADEVVDTMHTGIHIPLQYMGRGWPIPIKYIQNSPWQEARRLSGFRTIYWTICYVCNYLLGAYQQTFLLKSLVSSLASEKCLCTAKVDIISQCVIVVLNIFFVQLSGLASVYDCRTISQIEQLSNCMLSIFHEGKFRSVLELPTWCQ